MIAGLALVMIVIASTAILAQRGKQRTASRENRIELVQTASSQAPIATSERSGEMSPESLTSPSLWSKEYIHGPGGKVIATEERGTFTDVAEGSQFYEDIYRIAARGVTLGCSASPLMFCPDPNPNISNTYGYVTRQEMAAFIVRAVGEFDPPMPATQRFIDVPPSNQFYKFIDRLAVLGITRGCNLDGQGNLYYCPTGLVNHEQMAAFIDRAIQVPAPPMPPSQTFCDVPPTNQFYNEIEYYANSHQPIIWPGCGGVGTGIAVCGSGCSTNRCFCPSDNVTRRQMAHILVKAFGN